MEKNAGVWVKASDRLPNVKGHYIIRRPTLNGRDIISEVPYNPIYEDVKNTWVEKKFIWLDESELQCSASKFEHNKSIFALGQCQWCYSNEVLKYDNRLPEFHPTEESPAVSAEEVLKKFPSIKISKENSQILYEKKYAIAAMESYRKSSPQEDRLQKAVELLTDAAAQIRYLGEKFGETGTGNAVATRIEIYLESINK